MASLSELGLLRLSYRFWPLVFMATCILAVVFLPITEEKGVIVEPTEADSIKSFLTSPPLIFCITGTALCLRWALSKGDVMTDNEMMGEIHELH